MSVLTKDQLEAFVHLKGSAVGQMLLKLLRARAREIDIANRKADGAEMYRGQGRALALDDLADEIEKSSDQIRRLQSPQKTQL